MTVASANAQPAAKPPYQYNRWRAPRRADSSSTGLGKYTTTALVIIGVLCAHPSIAAAQRLTANDASRIIEGCAAHARAKGQSHAIAVLDDGAHLVAVLRMDGNSPGITEFAIQKGAAVAYWRFSTADMATAANNTAGFENAPRVVTVPGGIPVYSSDGKQFLGAVGVSGEAAADDVACAEAGVKAAGLSSSRK
jgi:uncharacterized protein GlcG (DUF336 family)